MQRWSGKRIRTFIITLACACVVGYFLFHAIQGDRGVIAMVQLQNQVKEAQQFLSQVRKERVEQEQRVKTMRSEGIDRDLLDEQSRAQLNYAKPNDMIILTPPDNQDKAIPQRKKD
jgi:cell division protein FtsB